MINPNNIPINATEMKRIGCSNIGIWKCGCRLNITALKYGNMMSLKVPIIIDPVRPTAIDFGIDFLYL